MVDIDPAVIHEAAKSASPFYPYASWHPLPENATQPIITPVQLILHTEASGGKASNQASWNYWARDDIKNEAHFLLDMAGDMWQTMATNRRADNNVKANVRAISIETQDLGGATVDKTPWTEEQLEQLAGLAAWCHLRWGIPLEPCPTWDSPGTSPHNAFPAQWSSSAHSCPGKIRTTQVPEIRARAQAIVDWTPPSSRPETIPPPVVIPPPAPTTGDDMSIRILRSMTSPPEFYAQFIAECDKDGHSIEVQWTGDGNDQRVTQRLADLKAAGITEQHITFAGLRNNVLHPKNRPSDITDALHSWSAADFAV